jgi:hypothetical protein
MPFLGGTGLATGVKYPDGAQGTLRGETDWGAQALVKSVRHSPVRIVVANIQGPLQLLMALFRYPETGLALVVGFTLVGEGPGKGGPLAGEFLINQLLVPEFRPETQVLILEVPHRHEQNQTRDYGS